MHLPEVDSLEDLSVLAVLLERRAAERFRRMAEAMDRRGRPDLSALFARLAREEADHEAALRDAAPTLDDSQLERRWPAALGDPPRLPEPSELAGTSLYQCLAEAVRGEEKAFRFYSYLAANSENEALAARAEALAKEELAHAALLRQVRRAAYHRESRPHHSWPKPHRIGSLSDLRRAALPRELALRRRPEAASFAALTAISDRVQALLAPTWDEGALPAPLGSFEADCAAAFAFYDQVASGARDETVMLTAQSLSALALERLKLLADR